MNRVEQIKPAKIEEIGALLDFWSSIPGIDLGRGDDRRALEMFMTRNTGTCLVIRENGVLVGTVMAGFDGRRGYIYHLAVHPQYQGQGYGKALLEKAITELENLGAQKIHLTVFNDNHRAIEFYRRQGWKERDEIKMMSWETTQTAGLHWEALQEAKVEWRNAEL